MKVDTFVDGVGTVRECKDCGALIAGGPVRCIRCAKEGAPDGKVWWRRLFDKIGIRR